jgi:excisionase family DNA binding protein
VSTLFSIERGGRMEPEDTAKTPQPARRLMTVREVSAYLRVHPGTLYRLVRSGRIPAFRISGDWRFNVEAIDRWTSEQEKPVK